jgi:hypothetical protein
MKALMRNAPRKFLMFEAAKGGVIVTPRVRLGFIRGNAEASLLLDRLWIDGKLHIVKTHVPGDWDDERAMGWLVDKYLLHADKQELTRDD